MYPVPQDVILMQRKEPTVLSQRCEPIMQLCWPVAHSFISGICYFSFKQYTDLFAYAYNEIGYFNIRPMINKQAIREEDKAYAERQHLKSSTFVLPQKM